MRGAGLGMIDDGAGRGSGGGSERVSAQFAALQIDTVRGGT